MVSNYSPRLSCSRREHWSGSITPPRPLVPPSYPLLCRLTIHQVLSRDPPAPLSVSDPLCQPLIPCAISHHGLSPRRTAPALSRRERKGQWSPDGPHRGSTNLQDLLSVWALFPAVIKNPPHHVTFIPSSCADWKLDRSIIYLTTHDNSIALRFYFTLTTYMYPFLPP